MQQRCCVVLSAQIASAISFNLCNREFYSILWEVRVAQSREAIMRTTFFIAVAALATIVTPTAYAQNDAASIEDGARVYLQCSACHSFDPAQRRPGPHLKNLIGRTAGSVDGFRYSTALQESGIIWTEETLSAYLENPRVTVPGTTMFVGVSDPTDRENLIAYLIDQSSNVSD